MATNYHWDYQNLGNWLPKFTAMQGVALKLPWCFYQLIKMPPGCYFDVRSPILSDVSIQPEDAYFCILKVTVQVRESQKDKS